MANSFVRRQVLKEADAVGPEQTEPLGTEDRQAVINDATDISRWLERVRAQEPPTEQQWEEFTSMGPNAQLATLTALTEHSLALSQATRDKNRALDPEAPGYLRQVFKLRATALFTARAARESLSSGN